MIIAHPRFGLGNRLICIASCLWISQEMGRECKILWLPDKDCQFSFEEMFLPNSKLKMLQGSQAQEIVNEINETIDEYGARKNVWNGRHFVYLDQYKLDPWINRVGSFIRFHNSFKKICVHTWEGFGENTQYFNLFKPIHKVGQTIEQYDRELQLSSRIGIHIRTAEHFADENQPASYYPHQLFRDQIEKTIRKDSKAQFFVSSDNQLICKKLHEEFRGSIAYIVQNNDRYSLAGACEALVDAYCLSRTKEILGNPFSSFSHMSAKLGGKEVIDPLNYLEHLR